MTFARPGPERPLLAPLWPIALARPLIGLLWLYSLRWKLPPAFAAQGETSLLDWLLLEVAHPAFPIYAWFVETIVLPNFTLFAWLIFGAELVVGTSLLLGLFTPVGALGGLLLSLNLGIGLWAVPGEWPWSYVMLAMWHGLFLVAAPGRQWGLDGWLQARGRDRMVT